MKNTDLKNKSVGKAWEVQVPIRIKKYAEMFSIYVKPSGPVVCTVCNANEDLPPLTVEWEEGSDLVGDFTFALGRIVLKSSVADDLLLRFTGFKKGPVIMKDHPRLHRPVRITKKTKPRVWLPYVGPELCELVVTRKVSLLPICTVTPDWVCESCGRIVYKSVEGTETRNSRSQIPREPLKGLFFRKSDIQNEGFFQPHFLGHRLCTEGVKKYIEEKGYSNVEFLEAGDILQD